MIALSPCGFGGGGAYIVTRYFTSFLKSLKMCAHTLAGSDRSLRLRPHTPIAGSIPLSAAELGQCAQTCDTPVHMRGKSLEVSGLSLASAGHVRGRLSPARIDRCGRAAAHTCLLSGRAPMPSRMSALVLSSTCIKSRPHRSRGGFQHLPNNFLYVRTDPSCTLE